MLFDASQVIFHVYFSKRKYHAVLSSHFGQVNVPLSRSSITATQLVSLSRFTIYIAKKYWPKFGLEIFSDSKIYRFSGTEIATSISCVECARKVEGSRESEW
eukprot:Phypoly_transcript_20673.p1 GENE.Phypoly_transcript_20673~~Phypoly_transcript_20673.p1  ORF type:complete len:102 (+),score=10.97 Phypoly_transcript_20673:278-583(+)